MNILFVCNQGKYRSPSASKLWKEMFPQDKTDFIGIYTNDDLKTKLSWSESIFVMEEAQYDKILELHNKVSVMSKIKILEIEDIYKKDDPKLINILKMKFKLLKNER